MLLVWYAPVTKVTPPARLNQSSVFAVSQTPELDSFLQPCILTSPLPWYFADSHNPSGASIASQYSKIRLVYGSLDDDGLLAEEAEKADVVLGSSPHAVGRLPRTDNFQIQTVPVPTMGRSFGAFVAQFGSVHDTGCFANVIPCRHAFIVFLSLLL